MKQLLLAWFEENGRDLPWRHTRDPYAILVCEVMLQQTQVERVVPRYRAGWSGGRPSRRSRPCLRRDVIVEWQGLGYNRRALNLHRAAQQVAAARLAGRPDRAAGSRAVHRRRRSRTSPSGATSCRSTRTCVAIQERTGERFDGACTQALFDLGATICLARIPRCDACPLAERCPSRGRRYAPLRKQSRFEGSFRQRRAAALRAVAAGEQPDDGDALASLARDGLVVLADGFASLPA